MLSLEEIDRLTKLVRERGMSPDVLDRMIELFNYHDQEGRLLLLDLVSRFEVCGFDQYMIKARELSEELIAGLPEGVDTVVLLPILDRVPAPKSKSGDAVSWLMSRSFNALATSKGKRFEMASQTLSQQMIDRAGETAFVMVDDYIGSGRTAHSAVERLLALGIPAENIVVGGFVGMQAAVARLAPTKVRLVFLSALPKGISDFHGIADRDAALDTMREMERKMKVSRKFNLGYEQSEALAMMCFCPNNTFPVFWWRGPTWPGVFER